MSEEGDSGPKYVFFTVDGETKDTSRDYTGFATATYPDGEIYEGYFVEGKREGKGTYRYINGDVYTGNFVDNKKHGLGTLTYSGFGEYKGFWENGRRHGEGIFKYFKTNDSYSGWWKFGQKQGTGTYCFAQTGQKIYGEWEDGKVIKGTWTYPNGISYEGGFNNNKPDGTGVWTLASGKCKGSHTQKVEEPDPDAPEPEEGEEPPKAKINLTWTSDLGIAESSDGINAIER